MAVNHLRKRFPSNNKEMQHKGLRSVTGRGIYLSYPAEDKWFQ
ncbi:hypothetical protein Gotur_026008 [Gossypium turneri]